MSRRALATSAASRLGVLSLLERLPARPLLVVLAYHRIMRREDSKYDPNVIEATPDQFDEHLEMLRKRHSVVEPLEMLELIDAPSKLRHLRVALTFDDGYRDNYQLAFPILKSHGLRATFFVATDFVGTRHLPWWDQVGWMVRHAVRPTIHLRYPRSTTVMIDEHSPARAIRDVLRELKGPGVARAHFMKELEEATGVAAPEEAEAPQFFSWHEAAEMERAGMSVGSHSRSHPILATLSAAEQSQECVRSRAVLREKSCSFADCLAYPVGERDSFSSVTIEAAREAGYRFGFSNFGGVNDPVHMDRFNVKRFGFDMSADSARQLRLRLAWTSLFGREPW